ncbi:histidine phosphatase family protein [Nocardioides sp. CFH 31398]|uniref:histidine phosphatase family protein n=1 Tax=Nocardioides sp. CFH 31398 TaxID=2919579 RepID=UPI001F06CB72|nr:histidine phosphatase family protein [Nocardioides sp. CFH 31398]MCH1867948.1 histidine phosphatase family protein [Nocardioides sp. CFH 31398]
MGVILLVKHAQASHEGHAEGGLTALGRQQARRLGGAMSANGVDPDIVATGTLPRHRETVDAMTAGAVDTLEDEGWNGVDTLHVLSRLEPSFGDAEPTREEFQAWTEQAFLRWASGEHDSDYDEPFRDFTRRVARAKLGLVARMGPDASAVVVTSGGPIAWIATALWAGWGPEQLCTPLAASWSRLSAVVVDSSVTKVALAPRGLSLVSFNDHSHLERTSLTAPT